MPLAFSWLYRRLGVGYLVFYVWFEVLSAALICAGTLGMLSLYQEMSTGEFLRLLAVAEGLTGVALAWTMLRTAAFAMPIARWTRRREEGERALEAWRAAVALPRRLVSGAGWKPFVLVAALTAAAVTFELELPWYSAAFVLAGALVAIAYAAVLNFFASELFMRPLIADVARRLPADFTAPPEGVSLRWKLLGTLPLMSLITGVVVAGLSDTGPPSLHELGLTVVVAVAVAFTLSLELTLLVTRSVLAPVRDLLSATERVARGDLATRVPVASGDEMGALASSFNQMMRGLEERQALSDAFGSYVDPDVARRVLEEGTLLEGDEVEATAMFVDIRDFTAFAECASAREAVARLNEFFELVVPIVLDHGGHANKFIGDGLLAVFGTPEPLPDHADRAISAACRIAKEVDRVYGDDLRIGVGINSGPVVAGSVGGGGRLEFTVIGDPVNVAARVEEQTRARGETVLLTEATRCLLTRDDVELEPRGAVALRGKAEPVPLYAPRVEDREDVHVRLQPNGRGSRSGREQSKI